MALSNTQKNEIKRRANNGESGADLAREYGVSPSAISVIKNHYVPVGETKKVANKTAAKTVETKTATKTTAPVGTIKVVVSSTKSSAKSFELPVGSTFGDLMKKADEVGALEGVFKNTKSGEKSRVKKITDIIPGEAGSTYNVYLLPLKADSGFSMFTRVSEKN